MPARYGRYYRKRRTPTRRYRRRPVRRYRRTYRRRGYRRRSTVSSVVKLQGHADWHCHDISSQAYFPFSFSPLQVQGFSEYQAVYSHFKILKVVMTILRPTDSTEPDKLARLKQYAVVPSRTFAASQPPFNNVTNAPLAYNPGQPYEALGQTKWFKKRLVSETRQGIRVGFYPYTMVGTLGPASVGSAGIYQRVWEGKRWMPFSWAWEDMSMQSDPRRGTTFWGPFIVFDGDDERPWQSVNVQYTMYVKFKGQK